MNTHSGTPRLRPAATKALPIFAAEASRREHTRLDALVLGATSKAITLLDADGIIRQQSLPIKWLLGYEPAQLLGRPLTDLLHPGSQQAARRAVERMTRQGQLFDFWHLRFRTASGHTCWLEGKASNHLADAAHPCIVVFWKELAD